MSRKEFLKDLFEKDDVDEIKEIVKIVELLKSEKEEPTIYTTTFHST